MGGLKKALPITYLHVPRSARSRSPVCRRSPASSRRTRSSGRRSRAATPCSGSLAVVTAFLTATYMFRLLYLAFFGGGALAARGADGARRPRARRYARARHQHGAHGTEHWRLLHDAPPAMAIALVVLAIGSVARRVRRRAARARRRATGSRRSSSRASARVGGGRGGRRRARPARREAREHVDRAGADGVLDARRARRHRRRDDAVPAAARRGRRAGRALQRPARAAAEQVLRGRDLRRASSSSRSSASRRRCCGAASTPALIDGTVNGVGLVVRGWSAVLRRLQTGSVRAYAMSLFLGVVTILGYYLWR